MGLKTHLGLETVIRFLSIIGNFSKVNQVKKAITKQL